MAHVGSCSEGVGGGVQLKFCSSSPQISDLGYLRNTFGWVSWCYHNVEKKLQREKEDNNRLRMKVNILEEELANDIEIEDMGSVNSSSDTDSIVLTICSEKENIVDKQTPPTKNREVLKERNL